MTPSWIKAHLDENNTRSNSWTQICRRLTICGGHEAILRYHSTDLGVQLDHTPKSSLQGVQLPRMLLAATTPWIVWFEEAINFIHTVGLISRRPDIGKHSRGQGSLCQARRPRGPSIDGLSFQVAFTVSHQYPGSLPTFRGDLFVFGHVFNEIMTTRIPNKDDADEKSKEQSCMWLL